MFNPIKAIDACAWNAAYCVVEHHFERLHIEAMNTNNKEDMKKYRDKLAEVRRQKKIK